MKIHMLHFAKGLKENFDCGIEKDELRRMDMRAYSSAKKFITGKSERDKNAW